MRISPGYDRAGFGAEMARHGRLRGGEVSAGSAAGSVSSRARSWTVSRPRVIGWTPPPMRWDFSGLSDSVNSPGFPGSSTYYFNGLGAGETPGIVPQAEPSIWEKIFGNLQRATETVVPAYMQYKVWNENLKRARAGQAPLDPAVYAPQARVAVGVDPATAKGLGFGIGGVALIGLGLYLMLRRR